MRFPHQGYAFCVSDYIQFRAQIIAPSVRLMMVSSLLGEGERAWQVRRSDSQASFLGFPILRG
jgi:hypothetical protein